MDFPLLVIPYNEESVVINFPFSEGFNIRLSQARGKTALGSSKGWIIMANAATEMTLWNPIKDTQIHLPTVSDPTNPQTGKLRPILHKAILTLNPDDAPQDYTVLIIYGENKQLFYLEKRDQKWKLVEEAGRFCNDVISLAGNVYTTDDWGRVVFLRIDNSGGGGVVIAREITMAWTFSGTKIYLLPINGKLFTAVRYLHKESWGYMTYHFEVHRYIEECDEWEYIRDLKEWTIFLGRNEGLALLYPTGNGRFKEGCIYYTDDHASPGEHGIDGGHDFGVYIVKEERKEDLPQNFTEGKEKRCLWPLWFMPNLEDHPQ